MRWDIRNPSRGVCGLATALACGVPDRRRPPRQIPSPGAGSCRNGRTACRPRRDRSSCASGRSRRASAIPRRMISALVICISGARTRSVAPSTPAFVASAASRSNAAMNSGRQSGIARVVERIHADVDVLRPHCLRPRHRQRQEDGVPRGHIGGGDAGRRPGRGLSAPRCDRSVRNPPNADRSTCNTTCRSAPKARATALAASISTRCLCP